MSITEQVEAMRLLGKYPMMARVFAMRGVDPTLGAVRVLRVQEEIIKSVSEQTRGNVKLDFEFGVMVGAALMLCSAVNDGTWGLDATADKEEGDEFDTTRN